jgi:hypothetical protein
VRLLEEVTAILAGVDLPLDDGARFAVVEQLGLAGERHRAAVYANELGEPVAVAGQKVRDLAAAARPVVEGTLRAGRRTDGLYHGYNVLRIGGRRASVDHLGPMLEGQVAIIDSGLLSPAETVDLLAALRASAMFREDQRSYMLYPDRELTPFLERNTLSGEPPLDDPHLFVRDHLGRWHFNGDLSTMLDVEHRLDQSDAGAEVREAVRTLWRTTFDHDAFTGRSGTFFMFEGLGSIFWHMVAKLLLAVARVHSGTPDGEVRRQLAAAYDDIREGLNLRKTPDVYGAFPTDPYSHSPRHRGAQQPGMTGQAKEQVLARIEELGIRVRDGRVHFAPSLLHAAELHPEPSVFHYLGDDGQPSSWELPANALAFTYCGLPICYQLGDAPSIKLVQPDGTTEHVAGPELDEVRSRAIFERRGSWSRAVVTVRAAEMDQQRSTPNGS